MARVAIKATMTGDKVMRKRLEKIAADTGFRKEARGAAKEVWSGYVPKMQARTPVKRGRLKRSERMKVLVSSKKQDIKLALIAGGQGILYARKVHATHKTQSQFMHLTLMEAAGQVAHQLGAAIDLKRVK